MYRIFQEGKQHIVRIARGEDLVEKVQEYCRRNKISAGWVQGLGACDLASISFYNLEAKKYEQKTFEEDFELLSLIGNISTVEDSPFLHAHVTLGRGDMSVVGGHLNSMRVSGTGEVLIAEFESEFTRSKDEDTGLSLLDGQKIETSD